MLGKLKWHIACVIHPSCYGGMKVDEAISKYRVYVEGLHLTKLLLNCM